MAVVYRYTCNNDILSPLLILEHDIISKNFFYLVEHTRSLNEEYMLIAQRVLQKNSFWAHTIIDFRA